jgi:hypothetical protein
MTIQRVLVIVLVSAVAIGIATLVANVVSSLKDVPLG